MGTSQTAPKQVIREMAQSGLIDNVSLWLSAIDKMKYKLSRIQRGFGKRGLSIRTAFFARATSLTRKTTTHMKFGLTQDQYKFILHTVVTPLAAKKATVWFFGSRARGDHQKFSDLDLLIQTTENIDIGSLEETLINSNFPYKVYLVLQENLAESYKDSVEKNKILFLDG